MIERVKVPPKPKERRRADTRNKPVVHVTYIPGFKAYLLNEGPQQSEIRWAHNGNTLVVCNEFIVKVP